MDEAPNPRDTPGPGSPAAAAHRLPLGLRRALRLLAALPFLAIAIVGIALLVLMATARPPRPGEIAVARQFAADLAHGSSERAFALGSSGMRRWGSGGRFAAFIRRIEADVGGIQRVGNERYGGSVTPVGRYETVTYDVAGRRGTG